MNARADWRRLKPSEALAVAMTDLEAAARAYLTAHREGVPDSDAQGVRHAVVVEVTPEGAAVRIYPM